MNPLNPEELCWNTNVCILYFTLNSVALQCTVSSQLEVPGFKSWFGSFLGEVGNIIYYIQCSTVYTINAFICWQDRSFWWLKQRQNAKHHIPQWDKCCSDACFRASKAPLDDYVQKHLVFVSLKKKYKKTGRLPDRNTNWEKINCPTFLKCKWLCWELL